MRKIAALAWLVLVLLAGLYLGLRIQDGLGFRTDLLALLPREEQDPVLQRANEAVSRALGRRVIALVGDASRERARAAARALSADLKATGLVASAGEDIGADRLKALGALYFPHRRALLSEGDRALLLAGRGEDIAQRALAQAFGVFGMADANLLRNDPFLLLPSFFTGLPFPLSRLAPDDGLLTVVEDGVTWILVPAVLAGEPFELDVQDRVIGAFDASVERLRREAPGLQVKRLGAVFFAQAGSQAALRESSWLSTLSLSGTVLLILLVFRRVGPLLHNLLALGVGIGVGLAGSLFLFGELHVAALLFGTSLIGVAVDYSLHYSACLFDRGARTPRDRLAHVLPGILLGLLTTLIGYMALMLAPFPGLRQIAVFSVLGLVAAFLTVVLWLPALDRSAPLRHGAGMLAAAGHLWRFWEDPRWRRPRALLLLVLGLLGVAGLTRLHADDDVRRMQSLSPALVQEQEEIQRRIGATTASQFILVRGADDEEALRREEAIAGTLDRLRGEGVLAGFQMPAAFVPSARRQAENRALVRDALEGPWLAAQREQLGLPPSPPEKDEASPPLTLAAALGRGDVPFLGELVLGPGLHVVALQGLTRPDAVRAALAGAEGVRLVDPTADFSALLAKYRQRALLLIAASALLMVPALVWRYGWRGALRTLVPSALALALAPAVAALAGQGFTFFHAMALVLILSVGVDYSIFCAESGDSPETDRRAVTMVAVWLATLTTLLSFGLLAFSQVAAVHSFGLTMLVGVSLSFLLAPLAAGGTRKVTTPPRAYVGD
ncbi:MMPL family transporter [Azospirillum sp. sgz302134]